MKEKYLLITITIIVLLAHLGILLGILIRGLIYG